MTMERFDRTPSALGIVEYSLVETERGPGLLEWDEQRGKGFVSHFAWKDERGSHYVWWVGALGRDAGSAGECVIPDDRSQPIPCYIHGPGSYTVVEVNGVTKPVAQVPPRAPTFTLKRRPALP